MAQCASVELEELNCTDFTVSVLKAHDLSVYVPTAEYGEHLLLLFEGTATISQIDFELKLSEVSNQMFFVGNGHDRGGT